MTPVTKPVTKIVALLLAMTMLATLPGCSSVPKPKAPDFSNFKLPKLKRPRLPRVHKITIQQGNIVTQQMIDEIKPGMTKRQVVFVMGEPVLRNSFRDDTWHYVYTIKWPNQPTATSMMTLEFENEELVRFYGDLKPTEDVADEAAGTEDATKVQDEEVEAALKSTEA